MNQSHSEPDAKYLPALDGVTFRPVFIIGDHRSGTTLLYQMMSATQHFNVVTAYDVIQYGSLLEAHFQGRTAEAKQELNERFASLGLTNRIIDGVRVSPDLTEEYGFVIDTSQKPRIHPGSLERFRELCRKLTFIAGNDKPLLLKNPWDVLGFAYVKKCFPDAKLVFIHRHPESVINSQLRALVSMLESPNAYLEMISPWYRRVMGNPVELALIRLLFSPSGPFWKHLVPRHVVKAADYFAANIGSIPRADYIALRYEDLCAEPVATMDRILAFLGFTSAGAADFSTWIEPRAPKLLPGVSEAFEKIRPNIGGFLSLAGYDGQPSAAVFS